MNNKIDSNLIERVKSDIHFKTNWLGNLIFHIKDFSLPLIGMDNYHSAVVELFKQILHANAIDQEKFKFFKNTTDLDKPLISLVEDFLNGGKTLLVSSDHSFFVNTIKNNLEIFLDFVQKTSNYPSLSDLPEKFTKISEQLGQIDKIIKEIKDAETDPDQKDIKRKSLKRNLYQYSNSDFIIKCWIELCIDNHLCSLDNDFNPLELQEAMENIQNDMTFYIGPRNTQTNLFIIQNKLNQYKDKFTSAMTLINTCFFKVENNIYKMSSDKYFKSILYLMILVKKFQTTTNIAGVSCIDLAIHSDEPETHLKKLLNDHKLPEEEFIKDTMNKLITNIFTTNDLNSNHYIAFTPVLYDLLRTQGELTPDWQFVQKILGTLYNSFNPGKEKDLDVKFKENLETFNSNLQSYLSSTIMRLAYLYPLLEYQPSINFELLLDKIIKGFNICSFNVPIASNNPSHQKILELITETFFLTEINNGKLYNKGKYRSFLIEILDLDYFSNLEEDKMTSLDYYIKPDRYGKYKKIQNIVPISTFEKFEAKKNPFVINLRKLLCEKDTLNDYGSKLAGFFKTASTNTNYDITSPVHPSSTGLRF